MEMDFKSNYNYLILILRLFASLFGLFMIVIVVLLINSDYMDFDSSYSNEIIGLLAGMFLLLYLPYQFGKPLFTQRNNLIFEGGDLKIIDVLTKDVTKFRKHEITGFYTDKQSTGIYDFKTIILVFKKRPDIKLPQFLYWNFKDIQSALESNGIEKIVYTHSKKNELNK